MNAIFKTFSTIALAAVMAFLAFMTIAPHARAATGELSVRAVFVNRNSVLAMSKLRSLQLNLAPDAGKKSQTVTLKEDGVFSLPQTRNFHISHTQKLFRCETVDCENADTMPRQELAAGEVSIRVVTTKTNELSIKARGDSRFDDKSKPFLSPLTVIVSYE